MSLSLESREYFQIQENDIVAACVPSKGQSTQHALKVIGYDSSVKSITYRSSRLNSLCSSQKLAVINVSTFSLQETSLIHLNAQLGKYKCGYGMFNEFFSMVTTK